PLTAFVEQSIFDLESRGTFRIFGKEGFGHLLIFGMYDVSPEIGLSPPFFEGLAGDSLVGVVEHCQGSVEALKIDHFIDARKKSSSLSFRAQRGELSIAFLWPCGALLPLCPKRGGDG
ncbi:MAG: hypothetical protein V3T72_17700, partial [Thermoanaerobaculia bacterium]